MVFAMVLGLVLAAGIGLIWWAAFTGPTERSDIMPADRRRQDRRRRNEWP